MPRNAYARRCARIGPGDDDWFARLSGLKVSAVDLDSRQPHGVGVALSVEAVQFKQRPAAEWPIFILG